MLRLFGFPRRYRTAATLVSVLATTMVGVAAAAATASITPTCQWQALSLTGGWTSEEGAYNTGDPSFCVSNQIVYLSGSVAQTGSGSGTVFAQLPQVAWPSSTMYLNIYTRYGAPGVLRISTDGVMSAYYGNATGFTSLAGISFPVAGAATTPLPLTGGWGSAASQYDTRDPAVLVTGDAVHLEGSPETQPGNLFTHLAPLPPDAVPANEARIPSYAYGGLLGELTIGSGSGEVFASGGGTTGFTSLAGVTYPPAAATAYGRCHQLVRSHLPGRHLLPRRLLIIQRAYGRRLRSGARRKWGGRRALIVPG